MVEVATCSGSTGSGGNGVGRTVGGGCLRRPPCDVND